MISTTEFFELVALEAVLVLVLLLPDIAAIAWCLR
jgi:hypothetical protein